MSQSPLQDATVHTILCWRADSLTLFRIRPFLEEFAFLVESQHCDLIAQGGEKSCMAEGYALGDTCFACRYHMIRDGMDIATRGDS